MIHVCDINQPSLPTPFFYFLFCSCVYFCLYGPFNCIPFHKFSRQLSAFSLCSSGLTSALLVLLTVPRSGELRTQKLKFQPVRTQRLYVLPLKPGVRSVYSHTRYAYCQGFLPCLFQPFRSIHLQNMCDFMYVVLCVWNNCTIEMLWSMFGDLFAEWLRDWLEVVFSPDVTPGVWLGSRHQLTN